MRWHENAGVRWLGAEFPGAQVAFSTRLGGVSTKPFNSLNLGARSEDQWARVLINRRRLSAALDLDPARVRIGRQVHGAELLSHGGPDHSTPFAEPNAELAAVDGHVTSAPGVPLLVFVADCLPIALWGPDGAAMLHCGWRGLDAGILARGVEAVDATHAAIGPGIGRCCYQVGEEVKQAFARLGKRVFAGSMLDLSEVARLQLAEAGVDAVECANICTRCEEGLFFSHRRDAGQTGRQAGITWIEGPVQ
jgi:polyphenol oxidase